jgi:hypothetical protein
MRDCTPTVRMSDQFSRSTTLAKPGSFDTLLGDTMTHVYRISKGPEFGNIPDSIDSLEAFARDHGPGRYVVDEHSLEPLPGTKVSARAWAKVIHHQDGRVMLDPILW